MLNESALEAVRRDADSVSAADIYNAVDRILQARAADARRCFLLPSAALNVSLGRFLSRFVPASVGRAGPLLTAGGCTGSGKAPITAVALLGGALARRLATLQHPRCAAQRS